MTGRMPEEGVNPVEFPFLMWELWEWFKRLDAGRQAGLSGANRIAEDSIGWFFMNRGIKPQQWQLDAIYILDSLAMERYREKEK